MSQIQNDLVRNTDSYQHMSLDPQQTQTEVPKELSGARPSSGTSGWKIAGRVMLGIVTGGFSELIRFAYWGIRSCFSKSSPVPRTEPRIHGNTGLPAADPQTKAKNSGLVQDIIGKNGRVCPSEYQAAINEVLDELRGSFGSKHLPSDKKLFEICYGLKEIDAHAGYKLKSAIEGASTSVTTAELKNIVREHLTPLLRHMVLLDEAKEQAAKAGWPNGVGVDQVLCSLLTAKEVKREFDTLSSKDEIQQFAEDKGIGEKLTKYLNAMGSTLQELRSVFGADMVPPNIDDALTLEDQYGVAANRKLTALFTDAKSPVSVEQLQKELRSVLAFPLLKTSVEKALVNKASDMNLKLSRPAVVALSSALLRDDNNYAALTNASNLDALRSAIDKLNMGKLLQEQKNKANEAFEANCAKLSEEMHPLLRTYVEGLSFAPADAEASKKAVEVLADHMKDWKNISGTDEERKSINEYFQQNFAEDLKELKGSKKDTTSYIGNIYKTMDSDANRARYIVGGKEIPNDGTHDTTAGKLISAIESTVSDAKDQQFLSKLMNQRMWASVIKLSQGITEDARLLSTVPGGSSFPSDVPGMGSLLGESKTAGHSTTYSVTVSSDQKTASVQAVMEETMLFPGSRTVDGTRPPFGIVRFTFDFQLTLSGHEQGQSVQKVTLGQEFLPLNGSPQTAE